MLVMKDLMSSCVGQLFWHGASAHFKHLEQTELKVDFIFWNFASSLQLW